VLRIIGMLGVAATLAGCAVAPGYGYPGYGYAGTYDAAYPYDYYPGYAPIYGSIGFWGGGGCCHTRYFHGRGHYYGGGFGHGHGGFGHGGSFGRGGGHGGGGGGHGR
jgi:hypothetical protein